MANTLLTPLMITREALRVLHNNCIFVKGVNRQYSNEFAISGAKIVSTLNIREPNKYYVRRGQLMQTQNTTETYIPLTLSTQYGVDINFTSAELTLSLDDFSKRVLTPALAKVASAIDQDGLALTSKIYNLVGTPGTAPGTGSSDDKTINSAYQVRPILNAGMMLDVNATPRDENRRCVLSPAAMASMTSSLSGLFQDAGAIGEQYRRGVLGTALGFEIAMDQNTINTYTGSRNDTGVVVNGAGQTGSYLSVRGLSGKVLAGEVFNITGVSGVNPENLSPWQVPVYGGEGDINFVVLADAQPNNSGEATLNISPSIIVAGTNTPKATVTNSPADGAAIHWKSGSANSIYMQSLAYHQDAFTFATADLELPMGVDFAARETYDGISMRIVRAFDITNDQFPCRIDVLGGWAVLRPELACRITS